MMNVYRSGLKILCHLTLICLGAVVLSAEDVEASKLSLTDKFVKIFRYGINIDDNMI